MYHILGLNLREIVVKSLQKANLIVGRVFQGSATLKRKGAIAIQPPSAVRCYDFAFQ